MGRSINDYLIYTWLLYH